MEQTQDKVLSLLEFVKRLSGMRQKTVCDITKEQGFIWSDELSKYGKTAYVDLPVRNEGDSDKDTDLLLRIIKPSLEPCPAPDENIRPWLKNGWANYKNKAEFLSQRPILLQTPDSEGDNPDSNEQTFESFYEDSERVREFDAWVSQRKKWAEKQQSLAEIQSLFSQFYDIYNIYRQQPENFEMMAGNGVINDRTDRNINHPVFLKRVQIKLIAEEDMIEVRDSDAPPELFIMLLNSLTDINSDAAKAVEVEAQEMDIHPFDQTMGKSLMKGLLTKLSANSRWVDDGDDYVSGSDDSVRFEMYWKPVFFLRKKIDGTAKTISIIQNEIQQNKIVPPIVIGIVDPQTYQKDYGGKPDPDEIEYRSDYSSEMDNILLPKPANKEQIEIARKTEQCAAVLVQGPPGTGKTHTIANLVCHFLAQGKRVLITSQTNKALKVLKDKIPEAMQPLCVSMLNESNRDMERSVDSIIDYISSGTEQASREAEKAMKAWENCRKEMEIAENRVIQIRQKEFEPIAWRGQSLSPLKAALLIAEHKDELNIVPGEITEGNFPLNETELQELYVSNAIISITDENELNQGIPDGNDVIAPQILDDYWKREDEFRKHLEKTNARDNQQLIWHEEIPCVMDERSKTVFAEESSVDAIQRLKSILQKYPGEPALWMAQAIKDDYTDGLNKTKWTHLIKCIQTIIPVAYELQTALDNHSIKLVQNVSANDLLQDYDRLCEKIKDKGKVSFWSLVSQKELRRALEAVTIDNRQPTKYEEIKLIQDWLNLQWQRSQLVLKWDDLLVPLGEPSAESFGYAPENTIQQKLKELCFWSSWYHEGRNILLQALQEARIHLPDGNLENVVSGDSGEILSGLSKVRQKLEDALFTAEEVNILSDSARQFTSTMKLLSTYEHSEICRDLLGAIRQHDIDAYKCSYQNYITVSGKKRVLKQRQSLLNRLKSAAPLWASAIQQRAEIHGEPDIPEHLLDSWQLKQLDIQVQEICNTSLSEAEKKVSEIKQTYQKNKEQLASALAWYMIKMRLSGNMTVQSSLTGWKQTIKKIGKGTGKRASELRKEAQKLLAESQEAVPAWIMPLSKVMDSIDPSKVHFDIVIVDEASQADISSIPVLFMADKVIIVGDDEQVSPMAIGMLEDRMQSLRDTYITNKIPNAHLYDSTYSLYALAQTICKPLMLREHFRCVPEIIGYSNRLSYNGKIKPLREDSDTPIHPPVISFRVNGQRKRNKTNEREAETIVAAIIACMEDPVYDRKTFGVISLLGDDQVRLIDRLLFEHIDLVQREKRQILCGNASDFQGDERDVIFLSLVDNTEGDDGPLKKTGEGKENSTKQRYNVAFSRARDQIWVVYSMDPAQSLKTGDIRRDLIEYANDPSAYINSINQVVQAAESPFEEEVAAYLISTGFQVKPQYRVGGYRLDMVVGDQHKKIVLECDGERFHSSPEEIQSDIERQDTLERLGWHFIRLRGSEYYRDKEKAMKSVIKDLMDWGVLPDNSEKSIAEKDFSEINTALFTRIEQIVGSWHSDDEIIPVSPTIIPTSEPEPPTEPVKIIRNNHKTDGNTREQLKPANGSDKNVLPPIIQPIPVPVEKPVQLPLIKPVEEKFPQEDFLMALSEEHFEYIDNRETSKIIWVLYNANRIAEIERIIMKYHLRYSLEKRGSLATKGRPAWRIMQK